MFYFLIFLQCNTRDNFPLFLRVYRSAVYMTYQFRYTLCQVALQVQNTWPLAVRSLAASECSPFVLYIERLE